MTTDLIARMAHETNRAYCKAMGDNTQVTWDDAPDWQKDSCLNGVRMHVANPDATPEDSHISWMKEKKADGWVYGPDKDVVAKEHPCMTAYENLPSSQKAKDYIFRAVVHTLAPYLPSTYGYYGYSGGYSGTKETV